MRKFYRIIAIALSLQLSGLCAVVVEAANYWVDGTNGSDGNGCNASASPLTTTAKATIQAGITCMSANDTVSIRTGSYTPPSGHPPSGTAGNYSTITRHASEVVTITGTYPPFYDVAVNYIKLFGLILDNNHTSDETIIIDNGSYHIWLEENEIKNANGQGIYAGRAGCGAECGNNTIRKNIIHDNGDHFQLDHNIYISSADNLVEGNTLYNPACYNVQIYNGSGGADNNIVRGNLMYAAGQHANDGGTGTCGGGVTGGGINNAWYNNIFRDNVINSDGLQICCGASNTKVYGNVFYNNTGAVAGLAITVGLTGNDVQNNAFLDNPTNFSDLGVATNKNKNFCDSASTTNCDLSGASLGFVSEATGDFHLLTGSALKDAGATVGPAYDFDNITRPQGAGYDIGAFEFVVGGATPTRRQLIINY